MLRQADFRAFYSSLRHKLFASMFGIVSVFGATTSSWASILCPNNGTIVTYVLDQPSGSSVASSLTAGLGTPFNADYISYTGYGDVYVVGMCSSTVGNEGDVATNIVEGVWNEDLTGDNPYCWCRAVGYCPTGVPNCSQSSAGYVAFNGTPWVLRFHGSSGQCSDCQYSCVKPVSGNATLEELLYTTNVCSYNITFSCGLHGDMYSVDSSLSVVEGQSYIIPDASTVCSPNPGCAFDSGENIIANGWKCTALDSQSTYLSSASGTWDSENDVMYQHNYNCEAQWKCADGYVWNSNHTACVPANSLTYDCNNGNNEQSELLDGDGPYQSGAEVTLWADDGNSVGECNYPSGHYKFSGWDCRYTEEDIEYEAIWVDPFNPVAIQMPEYSVRCTANWAPLYPLQYTCGTINGNDVEGSAPDTTYHIASVYTPIYLNDNADDCEPALGWIFDDWECHKIGQTGTTGSGTMVYMSTSGIECDAKWKCADGYVLENGQCVLQSNYTLRYGIDAPSYLGVSAPGNPNPMASGTSYTLEAVPSGTGYSCSDWDCRYSGGQSLCVDNGDPVLCSGGATVSMPPANVSCRSTCSANNVLLVWKTDGGTLSSSNPGYCPYGDPNGISQIYQPTKAGHMFKGWLLTNYNATSLGAVDILEGSSGRKWRSAHGLPGTSDTHGYLTSYTNSLENGQWVAYFPSYGVIKGESACSMETMGSVPQPLSTGTPGSQTANTSVRQYCWCRVISYVSNNSTFTSFDNSSLPWIYLKKLGSGAECIGSSGSTNCAYQCAWATVRPTTDNENEYNSRYRAALYGMVTQ